MKITEKFPEIISNLPDKRLHAFYDDVMALDLKTVNKQVVPEKNIVFANEPDIAKLLKGFSNQRVCHIVQTDRPDFFRDVVISCMLMKKPDQFLSNPTPFFVNNFDGDPNYKSRFRSSAFTLKRTEEKTILIDEIGKFLKKDKATKSMVEPVMIIADEMLTNAFFHAPVDTLGNPTHKNTPRHTHFKLPKPVRFFMAHDNKRLMIGCRDEFGSINRMHLLQTLTKAYSGMKSSVDMNARSAGLGCKMMIDRSLAFYMVSKKEKQSLVFCALGLGKGQLRSDTSTKNLHLCFG